MGASQSDGVDPGTVINATADPTQTLQSFTLDNLAQFTLEQRYSDNASKDFHLFYVGRDNVHETLKYILSRARVSLYLNMFGFDDDELNTILMDKAKDPKHDAGDARQEPGRRQARETADRARPVDRGWSCCVQHSFRHRPSATHQISHTKGFIVDSKVGAEGSTNWSASGEGTFVVTAHPGGSGYKAQNNTQSVFTDTDTIARFQAELIQEHLAAPKGGPVAGSAGAQREPPRPRRRATKVTPEEPG